AHPRQQGARFEELFLKAAPLIPDLEIAKIWRWADWPDLARHEFPTQDIGIDLVEETVAGALVAMQCKCYAADHRVGRDDIKNFIAAAAPKIFPLRWFIATSDYTAVAEKLIKQNDIRVVDFREHLALQFGAPKPPRRPLPLQLDAIDAVVHGFEKSGRHRGRLIMACGTGKTFTALRIAEQLAPGRNANILFIAPSIALVAQARREWLAHTRRPLACTVICSDKTAGRTAAEDIGAFEITCEVTTDPARIAAALGAKIPQNTARVVFCTYQSLDKLSAAQVEHNAAAFNLAIIDEAHRTTGYLDESRAGQFQIIHDREKIRADRRLYMTATPRIYDVSKSKTDDTAHIVDMNDETTYGREFYRLSFKKAVEAGMLCDYRVIALGITEDSMSDGLRDALTRLNDDIGGVGKGADAQARLAAFAIALAINGIVEGKNAPGVLARTIAYASNIRRSRWFADALVDEEMSSEVALNSGKPNAAALPITAEHLDGTSSALRRNAALRDLNSDAGETSPRLITNAQLFTEGVDVPALNAVAFLDPRQSKVDTIQAVGRVMRRDDASGKTLGYIVVPVILPPGAELLDALNEDKSRFKTLGNVLRALQSHDERLYTELTDRLTFATIDRDRDPATDRKSPGDEDYHPVQTSLLDENAKQAIYAQIAKNTGIAQRGRIIADAITVAIEKAARLFKAEGAADAIADIIGTPSTNADESCKTAALLIANACIMHKRLEETGNLGGLPRIEDANGVPDPASALTAAWGTILRKDYQPIFQDAAALLLKLPRTAQNNQAIGALIQCAMDNATTLNELGFDHAGPLYHRVLGTAQSDGAFYTKNLSAYLLAGLAFGGDFTDWADPAAVQKLKIIDPACGTGTLLMAALNIIKKRAAQAQNLDAQQHNALHKKLVENAIHGFDINKYSVQLAACNLTIGAPDTDYERMNLHTLQHGPVKGKDGDRADDVRHGVLEKLLDEKMGRMVLEPPPLYGSGVMRRDITEVQVPNEFDAVIYNPPFTDTNKQGRRYSAAATRTMVERLQQIKTTLEKRDSKAANAVGRGSIGPFFTPLTTGLLSKKGKLAKIIPATACTSENGRAERKYIAENFHVEMVVTSHDPKHVNFSENTSIHECLLIGKRAIGNDKPTRFIQLAAYPNNVKEAETLIAAIENGDTGELFSEAIWPAEKMRAGDWTPVQWFNPKLVEVANEINSMPNLIAAGEIGAWNFRQRGLTIFFDKEVGENGNAFCTINEKIMQTISATPETKATPRKEYQAQADGLWSKASQLLITCRFRTTSSRLLAIFSPQPAFGDAFVPVDVHDENQAKALAAFLNSSFSVIQMLNRRTKILTYPKYEKGHMKTLMLPDPATADLAPLL
ncbi:MAG: DEAD/DEAH box helicase family protein, partial [Gammaproteobacteria bacterium]|nr:DEAD/DEAH box helicase family protein [Gammaproteobacteria bacterium]